MKNFLCWLAFFAFLGVIALAVASLSPSQASIVDGQPYTLVYKDDNGQAQRLGFNMTKTNEVINFNPEDGALTKAFNLSADQRSITVGKTTITLSEISLNVYSLSIVEGMILPKEVPYP